MSLVSIRKNLFALGKVSALLIVCKVHCGFLVRVYLSTRGGHVSCIGTGSSLDGNTDIGIFVNAQGIVGDIQPASSGSGFALIPAANCQVVDDSRIQNADDVSCVCTCVIEREPRTIFGKVYLYVLQASKCPLQAASCESHLPESVCSAELEAVFAIYDRTTTVLGMHCNPLAQRF